MDILPVQRTYCLLAFARLYLCQLIHDLREVGAQGFAGTLFVRSVEEFEYIQSHGPMQILADVGLPW